MKVFKTEKIIYLNDNTKYIPKIESDKILSKSIESSKDKFISVKEKSPQKFLNKKVCHFRIYKYISSSIRKIWNKLEGNFQINSIKNT